MAETLKETLEETNAELETVEVVETEEKTTTSADSGISRREKAALIIWSLDEQIATEVVDLLPDASKQRLAREMAKMKEMDGGAVEEATREFLGELELLSGGIAKLDREHLQRLFPGMTTEELNQLIYGVEAESRIGETALDILREIDDVDSLFTIISDESPQTIAMIASYMKPEEASKLLALLPEEKMINTVIGIASLEQFDSEVMQNVSNLLRIKLDTMSNSSLNKTDGIKNVANILNNVTRGLERTIFEHLDAEQAELSERIKEKMFMFEDIILLDNMTLQQVLAEIQDNNKIARALKNEKEELKEKILSCVSKNRRDMITEELEVLGPIRLSDVEQAQQDIANVVKNLEKDGKIVIQRGEQDVLI
ncbi:flagellar motor switch protein FliG [Listeria monocytogenes]|uniref:flagellar motor switch protein FliG n=1 Tax=Listeria monocytogenes TaxID=1639 RepID=UPI0005F1D682|nr:flagellar motor switch protein FliG [Listeria monocytogenes]EAG6361316.1 flagellar motor switch protein FliG [Listeria monocytogenes CFSAN002351]AKG84860.1 flagellar motor switch protein FliG [Listeria monocytogenes]AQP55590.1 flagellar motor switch protein FliG [Listeria monocytogenes]ASH55095.1 flagellar motor switch protein G [Listeria monocytogenes serotype 1/2a str. 10-4754]ASH57946.1 flagellar motor switch protein G [Listeria monocytogenes serotype 1/2a str. 10-4758]